MILAALRKMTGAFAQSISVLKLKKPPAYKVGGLHLSKMILYQQLLLIPAWILF